MRDEDIGEDAADLSPSVGGGTPAAASGLRESASIAPAALELFDRHGVAVYSLARAVLGECAAADDATADVLIDAARAGEGDLPSLLVDVHRRAARATRDRRGGSGGTASGTASRLPDGLDPVAGTALEMVCVGGCTVGDVASRLGRPRVAVLRILRQAVGELAR